MNTLSSKAVETRSGKWLTRFMLMMLALVGIGFSASAVPQLKGFNSKPGQLFFPVTSDTIKVYYTEPVVKTYWALEQDGAVVLEGTCTGKDQNKDYATIAMKTVLGNALANKEVKLGKANLNITKVEYDGDQVVENLGGIEWDITDAPICNNMNPYPVPPTRPITEIKANTNCSFQGPTGTYMGNSTQIVQVKARILQNDQVISEEVIFAGTKSVSSGKYGYQATNKLATDPVWDRIGSGIVEIQFYEVTYISPVDGEEKTLNVQPALPAKWMESNYMSFKGEAITFGEKKEEAKSQVNEAEGTIKEYGELLSYYPEDGTEGVLVFNSDVAIDPTNLRAELNYGNSDIPFSKSLPVVVSEDGMVMTIDLRGMLNNARNITGGYEFKDDNGNPTNAPTDIALEVTGLKSVDGVGLCTLMTSPSGVKYAQYGKMWRSYKFKDITFATPQLITAQFYDAAAPEAKTDAILANSNTMDLTIDGADVIESADVCYIVGDTKEVVPFSEVAANAGVWTVALPEAIRAAGSSNLLVGLEDVTYTKVDGETHIIEPLDVANKGGSLKQVASVEEIKALTVGTEFLLTTETLKVTIADAEQLFTMVEDETGGLFIDPTDGIALNEGKLIKGNVVGSYIGSGVISLNMAKCSYTEEDTDISKGMVAESVSELVDFANLYRLITVNASEDMPMYYLEDAEGVFVGEMVSLRDVLQRLPADYVYPEKIASVTGVSYTQAGVNYLILRSAADIVAAEEEEVVEGIAAALQVVSEEPFKVRLTDAKVTFESNGMAFVEDETGAAIFGGEEGLFVRGQLLNGIVTVMNVDGMLGVADNSELTVGEADVTLGKEIKGSELMDNVSRLVTFTIENNTFMTDNDSGMVLVDDEVMVMDMFGVLDEDFVWPSDIKKLTGVVFYDPYRVERPMVLVRDKNDIQTTGAGVETLLENSLNAGDVYSVSGVKVRKAGEERNNLPAGIYIVGGKKVVVK